MMSMIAPPSKGAVAVMAAVGTKRVLVGGKAPFITLTGGCYRMFR